MSITPESAGAVRPWPADHIERWPIERLIPYANNARLHSEADPDSVPEVPEQPVTQLGDLLLLGDHRVGCGDSTNSDDVAQVLAGAEPHLMVTDPPYGVGYEPSWRARRKLGGGKLAQGKVLNDDRADWREAYALFPGMSLMSG